MAANLTLEERVAALEAAVRELKSQDKATTTPSPPWLQRVSGILASEPDFGKVIEYGRYWRQHGHEPPQVQE